jgi:hypothetical protein
MKKRVGSPHTLPVWKEEFIRENFGKIPIKEICRKVGRSRGCVNRVARKLGVATLTEQEARTFAEIYTQSSSVAEASERLGWPEVKVRIHADRLGLRMSPVKDNSARLVQIATSHADKIASQLSSHLPDNVPSEFRRQLRHAVHSTNYFNRRVIRMALKLTPEELHAVAKRWIRHFNACNRIGVDPDPATLYQLIIDYSRGVMDETGY